MSGIIVADLRVYPLHVGPNKLNAEGGVNIVERPITTVDRKSQILQCHSTGPYLTFAARGH